MLWRPKPGTRVTLQYRQSAREGMPHGMRGVVTAGGIGPGPINAAVKLDDGRVMVVPRGNITGTSVPMEGEDE